MRARSVLFLSALSLVTGSVRALAVLIVPEDLNPGNSEVNASIDLSTSCYYWARLSRGARLRRQARPIPGRRS